MARRLDVTLLPLFVANLNVGRTLPMPLLAGASVSVGVAKCACAMLPSVVCVPPALGPLASSVSHQGWQSIW